jgi:hypothetical protein
MLLVILRFLVSIGIYTRNKPITQWNKVFTEKPVISQLTKKSLMYMEPEGLNYTVHKRPSMGKVNPDYNFTPWSFKIHFNIIFHLYQCLSNTLILQMFRLKCRIHISCPDVPPPLLALLCLIVLTIFGKG